MTTATQHIKRQKIETDKKGNKVDDTVRAVHLMNDDEFEDCVRNIGAEECDNLDKHLAALRHVIGKSKAQFSHVEPNITASNVFPFLNNNRTDWNNLSIVNKDTHQTVAANNALTPPWPKKQLNTNASCHPLSHRMGNLLFMVILMDMFAFGANEKGSLRVGRATTMQSMMMKMMMVKMMMVSWTQV